MYKQNTIEDNELYYKDFSGIEDFLLSHSSSEQAFINLSRIKEIIQKEELLDEIKRLIIEQIINQIRTTHRSY